MAAGFEYVNSNVFTTALDPVINLRRRSVGP
jgi:hypothetical protein